jgi:hypothetical protein
MHLVQRRGWVGIAASGKCLNLRLARLGNSTHCRGRAGARAQAGCRLHPRLPPARWRPYVRWLAASPATLARLNPLRKTSNRRGAWDDAHDRAAGRTRSRQQCRATMMHSLFCAHERAAIGSASAVDRRGSDIRCLITMPLTAASGAEYPPRRVPFCKQRGAVCREVVVENGRGRCGPSCSRACC